MFLREVLLCYNIEYFLSRIRICRMFDWFVVKTGGIDCSYENIALNLGEYSLWHGGKKCDAHKGLGNKNQ